jgi:hypothetical protein
MRIKIRRASGSQWWDVDDEGVPSPPTDKVPCEHTMGEFGDVVWYAVIEDLGQFILDLDEAVIIYPAKHDDENLIEVVLYDDYVE